jgi:hypothetical protein
LILKNPIYAGLIRYRKNGKTLFVNSSINIDPIIDKELFETVQKIFAARSNGGTIRKASSDNYVFGNVLYCGRCGRKLANFQCIRHLRGGEKRVVYNYRCSRNNPRYVDKRCTQPQLINPKVERIFLNYLKNLDSTVTETDNLSIDAKKIKSRISAMRTELAKANERKRKLQMKYVDDKITDEEYQDLLKSILDETNSITEQIKECEKELEGCEQQKLTIQQKEELRRLAEQIAELWPNMTNTEKKMFITIHFKRIELDGESIKRIELQV